MSLYLGYLRHLSFCRLSVTRVYCDEMAGTRIMQFLIQSSENVLTFVVVNLTAIGAQAV